MSFWWMAFGLVLLCLHCCLQLSSAGFVIVVVPGCVTRRKLQTPGNAEEHRRQETPTIRFLGVAGLVLPSPGNTTITPPRRSSNSSRSQIIA